MDKGEQLLQSTSDLLAKILSLDTFRMKSRLKDYKPSEVHCVEFIGDNADPTVTKLAESFSMTRGAMSKIAKKLLAKGLAESYQRSDNKKEIYFKLTKKGKALYNIHAELHKEFRKRDQAVFELVTEKELDVMLGFVERYRKHIDAEIQKLGVEIPAGPAFE